MARIISTGPETTERMAKNEEKVTVIDTTAQVRKTICEEWLTSQDRKFQAMTISELKGLIEKTIPVELRSKKWKVFNKAQLSLELTGYLAGEYEAGVYEAQKMRMTYYIDDETFEANRKISGAFTSLLNVLNSKTRDELVEGSDLQGLLNYGLTTDCTRDEYITQIALATGYYLRRGILGDDSPVITNLAHLNAWVWRRPVITATPVTVAQPKKITAKASTPAVVKPQNTDQAARITSLLAQLEVARTTGDKPLQKKIRVQLRKAGHYLSQQTAE